MLKAFFKPKWKNNDPQVRLHALQALDASRPESRAVLYEAVTSDSDARVRRLAIKLITDLDVLWGVAQIEIDPETRTAAQQRFVALLAGIDPDAPPLGVRQQRIAVVTDQKIIDEIARHGVEVELRRAALQRVEREALLGDIALNDTDAELRIAAVGRITQKSTLERVYKQARTKDKRVSGVVREKLEKLAADADRPARLRQRARTACATLEALKNSKELGDANARVRAVDTEWSAVLDEWDAGKDGAIDAELTKRYADARTALDVLFEEHAQKLAQQRVSAAQLESLRARKRKLCEQLETIADGMEQRTTPVPDDERSSANALRIVRDEWNESGDLPNAEQSSMRARYNVGMDRIEACIADSSRFAAAHEAFTELLVRAYAALESASPLRESDIKSLEKMRNSIEQPRHYALDAELNRRLDDAFSQLHARHAQHAQKVQDKVDKLKRLVEDIEQAVTDGLSKHAAELQREAQQLFDTLPPHEAGLLRKQGVVGRWQSAGKNIREMWSWKKWAGAPVKERLVEEMEALVRTLNEPSEVERNYHDVARQITLAREQWKSLGATDNTAAKDLWERFNVACEAAHAPCTAYFKAERAQRAEHAHRKEAICSGLEQFIAQTDWDLVDWNEVERTLRSAREEWSRVGPTERAQGKALSIRFRALMDDLAARLAAERQLNKAKKETLIKRMEQIADSIQNLTADSPLVQEAVTQAKQFQSQWKKLGVSVESGALWKTFRVASDRVFGLRQALHEAQDREFQENLERKRALCAQIEAFAQLQGDALVQARGMIQLARNDFENLGPVPKQNTHEVQQRFRDACRAIERQESALQLQVREQSVQLLQLKVQLCADLESAIGAVLVGTLEQDAAEECLRSVQESWQALAALDNDVEKQISARFQRAADTLHGLQGAKRDEFIDSINKQLQENLATKEQLCLRAEIAAAIDSPPEYRQQRMQFQVEQLARRMRLGESATDSAGVDAHALAREWEYIGAVPVPAADALQARFDRVRQAMLRTGQPSS